jgi:hypothetical protein
MKPWFEIDKAGLAKILARKGKEFAIYELIQNCWDEDGVTEVIVKLVPDPTHGYATLVVIDDAPNGFVNLSHAYTLFAESKKKANPEKRGRFNLGEKLVLALAKEARIITTTGSVIFNQQGRRRTSKTSMAAGSMVEMVIKMTQDEIKSALQACQRLIPPSRCRTIINGKTLGNEPAFATFKAPLTTEIENGEGNLVRSIRQTEVEVRLGTESCPAAICEMGIPVCEIEGKYVFNVGQKVPLTLDRDEVLPSFRKQLAVAAINSLPHYLDSDDANTSWATEAMTSPDATPAALEACMAQKFGVKRVAYDPSDPEANSRAAAAGYTVVTGGQLSGAAWKNVKAAGAILPAGQVTPSPKPYSPDGEPLKLVKQLTDEMLTVKRYAELFAKEVLGVSITVIFAAEVKWPYGATYGPSHDLTFNVGRLGKAWFNINGNRQEIDDLLIHEFGHEYCGNHLSEEYYKALTMIGSKLAQAIRAGRL